MEGLFKSIFMMLAQNSRSAENLQNRILLPIKFYHVYKTYIVSQYQFNIQMDGYYLLFLIIFTDVICKINEDLYVSKSTRTMSLQLDIINRVPYLQLRNLCHSQVTEHNYGYNLSLWTKNDDTQFENVKNVNQNLDLSLLVDTGSNQFWLADKTCSNCKRRESICPQMTNADKKIPYFKGYVQGVDSFITICENRIKFMCVKQIFGIGQLNANGILGLRENSFGISMIFRVLKKKRNVVIKNDIIEKDNRQKKGKYQQFQHSSMTLNYLGQQADFLIKKLIIIRQNQPNHIEENIISSYIQSNQYWQIKVTALTICQQKLINDQSLSDNDPSFISAYVDSGTSKIVLSQNLCIAFIESMAKHRGIKCKYQPNEGVDCSKIIENVQFTIETTVKDKKVSFSIYQNDILDPITNRLGFVCQPFWNLKGFFIILGYPFLRNYRTTFISEKMRQDVFDPQSKIDKKVWIEVQKIQRGEYERRKIKTGKSILCIYIFLVFGLSWVCLLGLDYVRDKRSKKIII